MWLVRWEVLCLNMNSVIRYSRHDYQLKVEVTLLEMLRSANLFISVFTAAASSRRQAPCQLPMPPLSNAPHLPNAEATHSNMFNIDAEGRLCCIRHKNEKVPLDRMEGPSQSSNNPGLVRKWYYKCPRSLCRTFAWEHALLPQIRERAKAANRIQLTLSQSILRTPAHTPVKRRRVDEDDPSTPASKRSNAASVAGSTRELQLEGRRQFIEDLYKNPTESPSSAGPSESYQVKKTLSDVQQGTTEVAPESSAPQDEYDQYLDDNPLPFAFIDLFSTPELTTVPSTPIAEPFSAGSRRNVQLMTPLSVPPPPKGKGKEREQPVHWPEFQDDPENPFLDHPRPSTTTASISESADSIAKAKEICGAVDTLVSYVEELEQRNEDLSKRVVALQADLSLKDAKCKEWKNRYYNLKANEATSSD